MMNDGRRGATRVRAGALGIVAVGALVLAGCGDDGDTTGATDVVSTTAAASPATTAAGAAPATTKVAASSGAAATTAAPAAGGTAPLTIDSKKGPLTMTAPKGATVKVVAGTPEVTAGNTFHLELTSGIGTVSRFKQDLDANSINKLKRYVIDTTSGILYESELAGKSEFHVYVLSKALGGIICTDAKGPAYTQAQAQAMYDACLSITA